VLGLLVTTSCAPAVFTPNDDYNPINIEEKVAKKFNLRIDKLKKILTTVHKMEKPMPIYLARQGSSNKFNFEGEVPKDAQIVGYLVKEHNKIVAKMEQGNMMTEISELLVARIQIEVETYNALIEYCKLLQATADMYRTLWINAENRVLQLEHKLKWQRIESKMTIGLTALGLIVILAL
jgi:uncharacterized protein YhbP (UPF0306 family)